MFLEEKAMLLARYYEACYWHRLCHDNWMADKDSKVHGMREQMVKELDRWTGEMDVRRDVLESLYKIPGRGRSEERKQVKGLLETLWLTAEQDAERRKRKSQKGVLAWLAAQGLADDADWRRL